MTRVAWLQIAPVKGLALLEPAEVVLQPFGVAENRRFYLVDDTGRLFNQLRFGPLVRVRPAYDAARDRLSLAFPDGRVVEDAVADGEALTTDFYGRPVSGRAVVGPWSEALSEYAGQGIRLVRSERPGDAVDRARGPVSLVSIASLAALARAAGVDEVDGRRFRMLIGIAGCAAHEEDEWLGRRVRLGEAVVGLSGQVARCAITTQNPRSGEVDLDTLGTIKSYRGVRDGKNLDFGVFGEVVDPGRIRVGDPVEPV